MKKPKYINSEKLVVGQTYYRCHGHHFPIRPMIYRGYNPNSGFGLFYQFDYAEIHIRRQGPDKSSVSLGEGELMLFDNLADAINLVRYQAKIDFKKNLEYIETKYIDEQVGMSLSTISPKLLSDIIKDG